VIVFPSAEKIVLDRNLNECSGFSHPEGVLFVRPERIEITLQPDTPNSLKGMVKHILYLGSLVRYFIEVFEHEVSQEVIVEKNQRIKGIRVGDEIALVFNGNDVKIFPSDEKKPL